MYFSNRVDKTFFATVLALIVVSCSSGCAKSEIEAKSVKTQKRAVIEIEKLGGKVTFDEKNPNRPVIQVSFPGTRITDAELKELELTSVPFTMIGTDAERQHQIGTTEAPSSEHFWAPQITDSDLQHLKVMPKLQSLNLGSTEVTDIGLKLLTELPELKSLDLSCTEVSDTGLKHLMELSELKKLGLVGTQITDAGLIHLEKMTNLERLYLSNTEITDAGLVHLNGLTNLRVLIIVGTQVTLEGVNNLKQTLENCKIVHCCGSATEKEKKGPSITATKNRVDAKRIHR